MLRLLPSLLVAALVFPAAPAAADVSIQATVAPALVIGSDFPDPDISKFGGTYYAYSTNNGFGHVPVASATSIFGPWTRRGNALPNLGAWASSGLTWAPDVFQRADGVYVMYYTARHTASGRQCIGAAVATSPVGPFNPVGGSAMICNPGEGGDIDASSFVDSTGIRYMLYKDDGNAIGQPTSLWLQRVAANGYTLEGARVELLRSSGIIEAPVLTKVGNLYQLFYSVGGYGGPGYQTSYATSTSLTGPYSPAYRSLMTTESLNHTVRGPGGADVIREAAGDHIVFHGWINNDTARGMYVAALGWANGYPIVRGSRVRTEAERGALNRCAVRSTATASQGQAVAYIDYADSWVQMSVYAARSGAHNIYVAYSAGYGDAQHLLSVNGGAGIIVNYPNTGWEVWRQSAVGVTLNAGWNTIRLSHYSRWAELDYIEVA